MKNCFDVCTLNNVVALPLRKPAPRPEHDAAHVCDVVQKPVSESLSLIGMPSFTFEHRRWVYWTDAGLYGLAVILLSTHLVVSADPAIERLLLLAWVVLGIFVWTLMEYLLHRFVLHGLPPFAAWHAEHHRRPLALICAPTLLSGSLIGFLVYLPSLAMMGLWQSLALALGVLIGYLAYTLLHHATHHWRAASGTWLQRRRYWHALHHSRQVQGCYGVTTELWDQVFRTMPPPGRG